MESLQYWRNLFAYHNRQTSLYILLIGVCVGYFNLPIIHIY
jgi:hypothetical protein